MKTIILNNFARPVKKTTIDPPSPEPLIKDKLEGYNSGDDGVGKESLLELGNEVEILNDIQTKRKLREQAIAKRRKI